ncbi:MAG: lipid-A-disaccharide synthase-related protein [Vulcanimicrobiaceae bacterium]
MKRVLFVSNGHGEEAIAGRLARDLQLACEVRSEQFGLVGESDPPAVMHQVGPRRAMPSGGLIAMGNLRNLYRDFRSGLATHTLAQLRFLRSAKARYDAAVAVGDTFALVMAKAARARRTVFVGTAKSVFVAPYGPLEERLLRMADAIFVRDQETAQRLRSHGVPARAPGNVIVDLFSDDEPPVPPFGERVAIFPGSRESAYGDAVFLCAVVRQIAGERKHFGATLSIAPGLDPRRFAAALQADGWSLEGGRANCSPFLLAAQGRPTVDAWTGPPGAMLNGALVVLGQAGTANEAAAGHGIPVAAFEYPGSRQHGWYRMRQRGLLGGAMTMIAGDVPQAARAVESRLGDEGRRAEMGRTGRERMGAAGGSAAIAATIAALVVV